MLSPPDHDHCTTCSDRLAAVCSKLPVLDDCAPGYHTMRVFAIVDGGGSNSRLLLFGDNGLLGRGIA